MTHQPEGSDNVSEEKPYIEVPDEFILGVDFGIHNATVIKTVAGEDIKPFSIVYIGNDGKAYNLPPDNATG